MVSGQNYASGMGRLLQEGFENPTAEAKARTWWHWISGNVSKKGITADLEAMKEVGIQEAQLFNVHLDFPHGPVEYLGEEWLDYFHFAAKEARRLNLELSFHNSSGWSSSGGPWITPENAMQTVVYSEVHIEGGDTYNELFPQPETRLNYYQDIAILAFPKPEKDIKIDGLDFKTLSGRIRNHLTPDTKEIPSTAMVDKEEVIDLTSKISKEGKLEWEVPKGEWVILRLGHTPTGKKNHPAIAGGIGLECDKMSKKAVEEHWKGGVQPVVNKLGDLIGTVVKNCLIDSYEVGTANWTAGFDREFERLRGYNSLMYLPTLAGYYIESGEETERFLWDFRRTIGDLIAENYYGYFGQLCHQAGMKFSVEPYWGPFDNMQVGATGDIVMCEFWSGGYPFFDSPKFVSSIAHLNGSVIVGAESFTGIGGWDEHPAKLKAIGDQAWAQGINRFIFHTYVHQPWDIGPGMALSYFGTDFNRLNTWWSQGKAFMDYIARSQFLLQQGKNVADVLVFTGDSSPNTAFLLPEIQSLGYDYDLIGANKLGSLKVENGQIHTSVGGNYRVLVLPDMEWIRPETLKKIEKLVKAGAMVIGTKPKKSPSLRGYPECDDIVAQIAEELWDKGLIKDITIEEYLKNTSLPPDFTVDQGNPLGISFIHRKAKEADIYFIANAQNQSRDMVFRFRVSGKKPEIWNAETGEMIALAEWRENPDGTTSVPLLLKQEEAVFVVFEEPNQLIEHLIKTETNLIRAKPQPLLNLEILKAEYGTFLQEGLVDITGLVSDEIKNNRLEITANRQLCDCDPAMGYTKELRVKYSIGDSIGITTSMEREEVKIDAGAKGDLKIIRALFGKFKQETIGVPEHFQTHDVTQKIKNILSSGVLEIPVNDELIDSVGREGRNKMLRISYSTSGETYSITIPEGEILHLSKESPEPRVIMEDDAVNWISPYPGTMTYATSKGKIQNVQVKSLPAPIELAGNWKVSFPIKQDVSEMVEVNALSSWADFPEETIRYFSGTATYSKEFDLLDSYLMEGHTLELDLGSVGVIAEVIVNGENVGILWKAPFRVNIEDFVKEGENILEVRITNLWPNRLIGDEHLPLDYEREGNQIKSLPQWLVSKSERPSKRTTFSSYKHWNKDSILKTSGLLGPVVIRCYQQVKVLDLSN
ncbi:glycosyl hydrolase [Echinicola sediminis]